VLVMALGIATAGCGASISYRYDTGSVRAIQGAAQLRARATEAIDARDGGRGRSADAEMRDVRRSVDEHLVRAAVVPLATAIVPAPSSPADVDRILSDAAGAGSSSVVFVRYHGASLSGACGSTGALAFYFGLLPWLILDSIPFWHHGGYGIFEVVAVEPTTREVLGRSMRAASFSEHVSSWGCGADGVMRDMMRRALDEALQDIVEQNGQQWPHRMASPDLTDRIVVGPTFQRQGDLVTGPGYSFEAPAAYEELRRDPAQPLRAYALRAPDGFQLTVIMSPSDLSDHDFSNDYANNFHSRPGFAGDHVVAIGPLEGRDFEVDLGANHTHQRVTSAAGMALVLMCVAPPGTMDTHRAECDRALSTFAPTDELVSDGHR
jgi:hypothetical protein